MKLNLLVLRTARLAEMLDFYTLLGLDFEKEKHGNGPEHYAAVLDDGMVLELYPIRKATGLRMGFMKEDSGHGVLWTDPDGNTVEILKEVQDVQSI